MEEELRKHRVLICEDDAASLLLLRTILEKHGYEVVGEATTGIEAINLYDQTQPDLVLLDINMPKGGGVTTLRFMRELNPHPYIVMLTGDSSKFHVETTKKLGANDYLLKSSVQKPNFMDRLKAWCDICDSETPLENRESEAERDAKKEEAHLEEEPGRKVRRMVRTQSTDRRGKG